MRSQKAALRYGRVPGDGSERLRENVRVRQALRLVLDETRGSFKEQPARFHWHSSHLLSRTLRCGKRKFFRGGRANTLELHARAPLDIVHEVRLVLPEQRDGDSRRVGASRSPGAVDVRFEVLRWLNLHDELDTRNVKSSRSHVGGDEDRELSVTESLERRLALRLRDVAVQDARADGIRELPRQLIGVIFGFRKHEAPALSVATVASHNILRHLSSALPVARQREVPDIRGRLHLVRTHEVDGRGVFRSTLESSRDVAHPRRDGGGEEERLSFVRGSLSSRAAEDHLNIFDESHLEHFVRLVEAPEQDVVERERTSRDEVLDATWRSDDGVAPSPELRLLRRHWASSVHAYCFQSFRACDELEVGVHLFRELARGCENEHARSSSFAGILGWSVVDEPHHDGKHESERFALSCLSTSCEVHSVVDGVECFRLDGKQRLDSLVRENLLDFFRDAKVGNGQRVRLLRGLLLL